MYVKPVVKLSVYVTKAISNVSEASVSSCGSTRSDSCACERGVLEPGAIAHERPHCMCSRAAFGATFKTGTVSQTAYHFSQSILLLNQLVASLALLTSLLLGIFVSTEQKRVFFVLTSFQYETLCYYDSQTSSFNYNPSE